MRFNGFHISGISLGGNLRQSSSLTRVLRFVQKSSLCSRLHWRGVPICSLAIRTWRAILADRLFGHAAELGFYFLFALFPVLFSASSILGLAARSADRIYDRLLGYLSLVIPTSALGTILNTFNQTTAASTPGKVTFGTIAAIWSASVGISAVQDTLNSVYKIRETRSYFVARLYAIGLTILLTIIVSMILASMLGGDLIAGSAERGMYHHSLAASVGIFARLIGWSVATVLLTFCFAVTYNWAPNFRSRRWQWITPGGAIGVLGWLVASLGLRVYLHFFNDFSVIYGSLGAVIILLMWFYITGLMLLLGAEINSEFEVLSNEIHSAQRRV